MASKEWVSFIAKRLEITTMRLVMTRFCQMENLNFEPFGEHLAPHEGVDRSRGASKWTLWVGTAIFWSLAVAVVVARAAFFDPRVFAGFDHIAALTRSVTGF